jgi:hypothetical protein
LAEALTFFQMAYNGEHCRRAFGGGNAELPAVFF